MTHPNRPKGRVLRCALLSLATALGAAALGGAAAAEAEKVWSAFTFTTGLDYTVGDYGTGSDTSVLYIPFTMNYERGP